MNSHRFLHFLGRELVYGGHWFSLSIASLVVSVAVLLHEQPTIALFGTVYLLIQTLFNYNHYKELGQDAPTSRTLHLQNYRRTLPWLTVIYGIGFVVIVLVFSTWNTLVFSLGLLLIGLLFTMVFKGWTRKIVGFKSFYAGITMSLMVVFFPLFFYSNVLTTSIIVLFLLVSFRLIIGTAFSDIKDIETDAGLGLKTFAVYFGRDKFLAILQGANIVSAAFFIVYVWPATSFTILIVFTALYTFGFLYLARKPSRDLYLLTNLMVDGEFLIWPLILFIATMFT